MQTKNLTDQLLTLKSDTLKNLSKKDYSHLRKIIWVNRIFLLLGFGTAWICPNVFSMVCISLGLFGQWTMVAHHVCHGGYNNIPEIPSRYHSDRFALGLRRLVDWPDLLYPPAWKYEHNVLHHFYTNEKLDPDVASKRVKQCINPAWPIWLRCIVLSMLICTWKFVYYSTNILKAYYEKKAYDSSDISEYTKKAIIYSYAPYISLQFIIIPCLFFPLGKTAVVYVLINRIFAEILVNIHSFLTILPNHTAVDIPLQSKHFTNKEEFFVAQIQSACNYQTGGFWRDYLSGYLNYQIEHHLFPDLPMSQYVRIQPIIKAICLEHGLPYKQESIFHRITKTLRVLIMLDEVSAPETSTPDITV